MPADYNIVPNLRLVKGDGKTWALFPGLKPSYHVEIGSYKTGCDAHWLLV